MSSTPMTVDELLARHADARGGAARLEAMRSLRVELVIREPGFEAVGLYHAMRPTLARADIWIDGTRLFSEAYNEVSPWQQPGPGEPVIDVSHAGAAPLRRGALTNLHGLHELPAMGHGITLEGRVGIEDESYYHLLVTYDDGFVRHMYLDPEQYLVRRERSIHALHPDLDPTEKWIESRHDDFRTVDGIVRPWHGSEWELRTGEQLQEIVVRRVEINPEFDPALFDRPADLDDIDRYLEPPGSL